MADDEKYYFKDLSFDQVRKYTKENIKDIIACGFNPQKTFIFSNHDYSRELCVQDILTVMKKKVKAKLLRQIFGMTEDSCIGQLEWCLHQTAASYSPYYKGIFGDKHVRCLVAYAIDQDPYFRLGRDLAGDLGFMKPSSVMMTFLPALKGNEKMNASGNNPTIFMTDTKKEIQKKINRYAFSGGQETKELQEKLGGNCDVDISYQYLRYFLEDDDELEKIRLDYTEGRLLTGHLKKRTIDVVWEVVKKHQDARSVVNNNIIDGFMNNDNIDF